jgi:hypothetical protein
MTKESPKFNKDSIVRIIISNKESKHGSPFPYRTLCKITFVHQSKKYGNEYSCQCLRTGLCYWYNETELELVEDKQ